MFRIICSTFPFMVCLCWFVTFLLHHRTNDSAKHVLTVFLGTCTVLYFCHASYFNSGGMLPLWTESLWGLCSLSVFPLYFIYITHLTCRPMSIVLMLAVLLPGVLVAASMYLFPGEETETARKSLFALEVFAVLYFGHKRLQDFDREVANVYADTEGRDTRSVKKLLVGFAATAMLSAIANAIGKQNVAASEWLIVGLVLFGFLLHALSYMGYTRTFSAEQFFRDTKETNMAEALSKALPNVTPAIAETVDTENVDYDALGRKIEKLMEAQYYLTKNLKITDMAQELGTCRTYVSNYINKSHGCSFSDYINQLRIDYAKQLLKNEQEKLSSIADRSGFSSEQSFYRNFKKFVGMTPSEWQTKDSGKKS